MGDFVYPQINPAPDMLGQYIRGQMAPGAIQEQQNTLASQGLNLDQMRLAMRNQQAYQNVAFQQLQSQGYNVGGQSSQGGAQNGGNAGGSIQNGPQGSVTSQQPQGGSIGGFQPSTLGALALLRGDDPLKTAQGVQEYQTKQAQLQSQGPLDLIDSVFNSAAPAKTVMSNPPLMARWPQIAQQMGLDPVKDFNDTNVRAALAFAGNQIRGTTGQPAKDYPVPLQTTQRGLGESIQTDPITGKISGGASAMPTEKFVINGQVRELPKAQGIAMGAQPYDSTLYGADQITPQAMEQAYQVSKQTGELTQALAGRDAVAAGRISSYIAKRAGEDGISGLSMSAQKQAYKASQDVVSDFTSGKSADQLQAINTSVKHLGALTPLIDAMGSGDTTKLNEARQAFQKATGKPAPTNYQTLANMAVGEVSKAVTSNGGDAAERDAIAAPFASANSPEVLRGAVKTAATALAGKTDAMRNRWEVGTQGTQGSFDKLLLPETKAALKQESSSSGHPKEIQSLLDKYSNGR